MASKKYNQLVNIVKKEVTHRYREQAGGNQWWWGGIIRVREWEVETAGYKIESRMDSTTWGTEPTF